MEKINDFKDILDSLNKPGIYCIIEVSCDNLDKESGWMRHFLEFTAPYTTETLTVTISHEEGSFIIMKNRKKNPGEEEIYRYIGFKEFMELYSQWKKKYVAKNKVVAKTVYTIDGEELAVVPMGDLDKFVYSHKFFKKGNEIVVTDKDLNIKARFEL